MLKTAAEPIISGTSTLNSFLLTVNGVIMAQTPNIKAILQILEPTTLPMLISPCPFSEASTLTTSSGALVANATRVKPTTSGDIFIF
jgi:hypothetical protein